MDPDQASAQSIRPLWLERRRFFKTIQSFAGSQAGPRAKALFALLIAFILVTNGLNVLNSYVGRDFMTAIERRDMDRVRGRGLSLSRGLRRLHRRRGRVPLLRRSAWRCCGASG